MSKKIKVLISDDHLVVRMGISALLETEADIEVVGQAKNGVEAVSKSVRLQPDVVIMDLMMPKKDGIAATAELREKCPAARVIVLTSYSTSDVIARALDSGAAGAVLKTATETELVTAIRKVASGSSYVSSEIRRLLSVDPPVPVLTPRQEDILHSMVRGLTDRDIARQLGIRVDGVNGHVRDILQKLGAANRTEAVAIALRKHLL